MFQRNVKSMATKVRISHNAAVWEGPYPVKSVRDSPTSERKCAPLCVDSVIVRNKIFAKHNKS